MDRPGRMHNSRPWLGFKKGGGEGNGTGKQTKQMLTPGGIAALPDEGKAWVDF